MKRRGIAFLFCAFAALSCAAKGATDSGNAVQTDAGGELYAPPADMAPEGRAHYRERVVEIARQPKKAEAVAFVGDSITEGGQWAALFPDAPTLNFGVGWDTSAGLLNRREQIFAYAPEKLFLMIGTNDLEYGTPPAETVANIMTFLESAEDALPETCIYVQSVLPREPENAAWVKQTNALLEEKLAAADIAYIDVYSAFDDGDGVLISKYTKEGLHLNGPGYAVWAEFIRPIVKAPCTPNASDQASPKPE